MVLVCHVNSQITWSKRHVTFWVENLKVSHHPPSSVAMETLVRENWGLFFRLDLPRLLHQNVIWLYGQEPITVSFYPDKFGGQRHSSIKFLVCQVIWKDCMVKGSSDFMGLESLIVSHYSARFGGHKHCGKGDEMLSVVEEEDPICPCFNLPLIFLSKELQWLQFNMWSLSHVDRVLLTCLHVLGDTSWCSGTRTFICLLVFLQ